jgi:CBS domain-containing protein
VTPDEPVTSAARLMYHARVKRLPVVEEGVSWPGSSAGLTC